MSTAVAIRLMLTPHHEEIYDAFEHFRHSLFSSKGDLFTMLAAYFDDSGSSAFSAPIRPLVAGRFRPGIPKHSGHLLRSIQATPIVGVKSS